MSISKQSTHFSDDYRYRAFVTWYNLHKPNAKTLISYLEPELSTQHLPAEGTVNTWINDIFKPMSVHLDRQVMDEIEGRLVKEKIEMMERHATVGSKMQDIAIKFLDDGDIQEKLTPSTAIRLLIEGIRVERESRGLPQAMDKMINKSDEELLKELESIIEKAPGEIQTIGS